MKRKWKSKIIVIYYPMKRSNSSRSTQSTLKFSEKTTINSRKLTSICHISARISIKTRRSFSTEMRTEYPSKQKLPHSWTPRRIWLRKWNTITSCTSGWRRSRCFCSSKRKLLCLEISRSYSQSLSISWCCFRSRESLMIVAIWSQKINILSSQLES